VRTLSPPPLPPAWQALADRPPREPDQTRYGPVYPAVVGEPHERDGLLLYVQEGATASGELGWSVTCQCGWLVWTPQKRATQAQGTEHTKPTKKGDAVTYACPVLRKEKR